MCVHLWNLRAILPRRLHVHVALSPAPRLARALAGLEWVKILSSNRTPAN
jgi:hypothetical protein